MSYPEIEYCDLDYVTSVIHFYEDDHDEDGCTLRFSFPVALFWCGDQFAYVKEFVVFDVVNCVTREKALETITRRVEEIFLWEHRKAHEGITAVMNWEM